MTENKPEKIVRFGVIRHNTSERRMYTHPLYGLRKAFNVRVHKRADVSVEMAYAILKNGTATDLTFDDNRGQKHRVLLLATPDATYILNQTDDMQGIALSEFDASDETVLDFSPSSKEAVAYLNETYRSEAKEYTERLHDKRTAEKAARTGWAAKWLR